MRPLRPLARRRPVASVVLLVMLTLTPSAHATFAGPNGRISFSSDRLGHFEIYSVRPGGAGLVRLTHSGPHANSIFSDWSPDGRRIVFDSDRAGDVQLFIMRADGTRERQLTFRRGFTGDPAFSPDGRRLVFVHGAPDRLSDVYTLDLRTRQWQRVTRTRRAFEHEPQFSPDGRWIAVSTYPEGGAPAVYLVRPDGSDRHRLTPLRLRAAVPDWRPDGKRIVFHSNADRPNSDLYTIRPDGHGLRHVTRGPAEDVYASYSPGGGRLVFTTTRGITGDEQVDIWIVHADGTRLRPLVTGPAADVVPDWGTHR